MERRLGVFEQLECPGSDLRPEDRVLQVGERDEYGLVAVDDGGGLYVAVWEESYSGGLDVDAAATYVVMRRVPHGSEALDLLDAYVDTQDRFPCEEWGTRCSDPGA